MKVLLDINVVLDVLLNRPPWVADASAVWSAHTHGQVEASLAAFSVPTLFYIVRRQTDLITAQAAVADCLATFRIVPVDRTTLDKARTLLHDDFEDNLQLACALQAGLDALVTRDPSGFTSSPIPVLSADELLQRLAGPAAP